MTPCGETYSSRQGVVNVLCKVGKLSIVNVVDWRGMGETKVSLTVHL